MSVFQCDVCGCIENTALSNYFWNRNVEKLDKNLCSACDPNIGKWHDRFRRMFLERGKWITNNEGNIEHIETKETDFHKYELKQGG